MKQRIQMFDALKGVACLIVLFAHILSTDSRYGLYANGCGKIGVWCFMVMSGFLSFLPYLDGHTYSFKDAIRYYGKKIIKLYPAYCIVLIFAFAIGFIGDLRTLGLSLLLCKGVGHLWYMPVIAQFYLIFPILICIWFLLKKNKCMFAGFLIFLGALCSIKFPFIYYEENSIYIHWYLPVFLCGIILSIIWHSVSDKIVRLPAFDITAIIVVGVILIFTPISRKLIWDIAPSGWLQNKYLLMGGLWTILIFCLLFSKKLHILMEKSKILNFFGTISYELYLVHYIVLLKSIPLFKSTVLRGIFVFLLSVAFAWLLHYSLNYILNKIFPCKK